MDTAPVHSALDTLSEWRALHAKPLQAATRVSTAGGSQIEVSQRLKRIPTILDKLRREPGMELGRMDDIGGNPARVGVHGRGGDGPIRT